MSNFWIKTLGEVQLVQSGRKALFIQRHCRSIKTTSPFTANLTHPHRLYSTNNTNIPLEGIQSPRPKPSKTTRRLLIITIFLTTGFFYLQASPTPPAATSLNDTTFTPYTITNRTALSPSSFVLTISPDTPSDNTPIYLLPNKRWRHPLWSVEFKQPEVQISRHYTPLPPPCSNSNSNSGISSFAAASPSLDDENGELRFYIRAVGDGEMSRYLNRLRKGDTVHLRGPHIGFDLVKRLGASKSIVFLAGGTGVVPGMQAAKVALDGYSDTRVSLLWAVRQRAEVQNSKPESTTSSWWWWRGEIRDPTELQTSPSGATPVAKQLADMKAQYGERFSVRIVVDEENTRFGQMHIQKALSSISSETAPGVNCALHDQSLHEKVSEFEVQSPDCDCKPVDDGPLPGKNLFIVSGPDGFVSHYAGARIWEGGKQTQGAVGGVTGKIYDSCPELAQDWLVLKL